MDDSASAFRLDTANLNLMLSSDCSQIGTSSWNSPRSANESLNVETFFDLSDVREKLARWRLDYNQVRPHSALADRSPEEFARD